MAQMAKSRQDVVSANCVKDPNGRSVIDSDRVKEV